MSELSAHLQEVREADDAVARARQQTADAVAARARAARAAHTAGATWGAIGEQLGVSAQRAQQMAKQSSAE